MCISWAVGHMLTASAITVFLYQFRETLLSVVLGRFEFAVAIMLILLGFWSFKEGIGSFHTHDHAHDGKVHTHRHFHLKLSKDHYHKHMFGIGLVHGLASNDELLLLFMVSLNLTTLSGIFLGLAIFNVGVVLGMMAFGMVLNYPIIKFGSKSVLKVVNISSGILSVGYGVILALA